MRDRIQRVLGTITEDQRLEAKWLNTLSYLEFVRARNMARAWSAGANPRRRGVSSRADLMSQIAAGGGHAAAFAELAERVLGTAPSEYLCRDAAALYYERLDRELSAWVTGFVGRLHPSLDHLLVTSMIERRACKLYSWYRIASSNPVVHEVVDRIVDEQLDHGVRIQDDCVRLLAEWNIPDLAAPSAVESAFFAGFWRALEAELGLEESHQAA